MVIKKKVYVLYFIVDNLNITSVVLIVNTHVYILNNYSHLAACHWTQTGQNYTWVINKKHFIYNQHIKKTYFYQPKEYTLKWLNIYRWSWFILNVISFDTCILNSFLKHCLHLPLKVCFFLCSLTRRLTTLFALFVMMRQKNNKDGKFVVRTRRIWLLFTFSYLFACLVFVFAILLLLLFLFVLK